MRLLLTVVLTAIFSFALGNENIKIEKYIGNIFTESSEILENTALPKEERVKLAVKVIKEKIEIRSMAMFALGRAKKNFSEQQVQEFVDVYREYVLGYYAKTLKKYTGQKVSIVEVKPLSAGTYVVKTKINDNIKNRILTVSFIIKSCDGEYKIYDIITEGVSFLRVQRQEFSDILSKNGIEFLIKKLKIKINKLGIKCN